MPACTKLGRKEGGREGVRGGFECSYFFRDCLFARNVVVVVERKKGREGVRDVCFTS